MTCFPFPAGHDSLLDRPIVDTRVHISWQPLLRHLQIEEGNDNPAGDSPNRTPTALRRLPRR